MYYSQENQSKTLMSSCLSALSYYDYINLISQFGKQWWIIFKIQSKYLI